MDLEQRNGAWWITGVPDTVMEYGPYDTKAEAAGDMRGLANFFRRLAKGKLWMTCENEGQPFTPE